MASQAVLGAKALEKGDYAEAISQYTAALRESPTSPDYYIKRSMANHRSAKYEDALKDASIAVVAAVKRAKRELIIQAQLRRAMALFSLDRYGDAKFLFDIVEEMNPKEKQLPIWKSKVTTKLEGLDETDKNVKLTVEKIPNIEIPQPNEDDKKFNKNEIIKTAVNSSVPEQTPPSKIKHDWYQNSEKVYLTLLAKGVPKDKAAIEIQERSINISFPTGLGTTFDFSLDPLYEPIDTTKSTFRITPTKIELTLEKVSGKKWQSLESNDSSKIVPKTISTTSVDSAMKTAVLGEQSTKVEKAPSYPTSSKKGPRNWDKVAEDMEVDKEGDDVNNFFQTLYSGADEDTKRAMMKSYQESNGTVLSTNWAEVGKGKVETSPPDGMVAKKWGDD